MELVPQSVMEEQHEHYLHNHHHHHHLHRSSDSQRFAAGCFSLLRQVYARENIVVLEPSPALLAEDFNSMGGGGGVGPISSSALPLRSGLFSVDKRFAELRLPYSHLRAAAFEEDTNREASQREDEGGEVFTQEGVQSKSVKPLQELEKILRRFLNSSGEAEKERLLEEASSLLEDAIVSQKKRHSEKSRHREVSAVESHQEEEEEEEEDLALCKEYVQTMAQILKEGTDFVDVERSELSLALTLSYEQHMSATDRNRLLVLDAVAEESTSLSKRSAPGESHRGADEEDDAVKETSLLASSPLPLPSSPAPSQMLQSKSALPRHLSPSREGIKRRKRWLFQSTVESAFLTLLSLMAAAAILILLYAELNRDLKIAVNIVSRPGALNKERASKRGAINGKHSKRVRSTENDKRHTEAITLATGRERSKSSELDDEDPAAVSDVETDDGSEAGERTSASSQTTTQTLQVNGISAEEHPSKEGKDFGVEEDWIVSGKRDESRRRAIDQVSAPPISDLVGASSSLKVLDKRASKKPLRTSYPPQAPSLPHQSLPTPSFSAASVKERSSTGMSAANTALHQSAAVSNGWKRRTAGPAVGGEGGLYAPQPSSSPAVSPLRSYSPASPSIASVQSSSSGQQPLMMLARRQRGPQDDYSLPIQPPSLPSQPVVPDVLAPSAAAVTIALMVRTNPGHSYSIRVRAVNPQHDIPAKYLNMRRSIVDPVMWLLTLRVPQFACGAHFLYKYEAMEGGRSILEESGEPRRIYLGDKDCSLAVEQEDFFPVFLSEAKTALSPLLI